MGVKKFKYLYSGQLLMQVYKSGKTRIGVMIMLLTGIAIAGIASMLPANTSAQQQRAETALSIASCPPKLIKDTPPGHDVGWDPDGTNDRFLINDSCYLASDSTVLVNIRDGGFAPSVCNVDWTSSDPNTNSFEIKCDVAPANATELRYIIFYAPFTVIGGENATAEAVPKDLMDRNATLTNNSTVSK